MGTPPPNCNALRLIDDNKDFYKENCEWHMSAVGRPRKIVEKDKGNKKTKNVDTKILCVTMEKSLHDRIKSHSVEQTHKQKMQITVNELIRNALQKAFPGEKI